MDELEKAIAEVQQPRSKFQIERFVLGQHATREMQYYQTCIELSDMIQKYKLAQIAVQKLELKIMRLRQTGDELDELKAQEKEIALASTRLAMIGAEREMLHLKSIWESFEKRFTREEIEAAQPEYWTERLTNNARAMLMGGSGVNPAHIEAMQQAGILDNFVKEVEQSRRELAV